MVEPEGKTCTIVVAIKETTGYEYVETVAPPQQTMSSIPPVARPVAAVTDDDLPF
jgi:hypothetical protein